jgi:hypothetical protein
VGKGFGDVSVSMAWLPPVNVSDGRHGRRQPKRHASGFALEYSLLTNSCSADKEVLTASPRVWCRWWNSQCRRH